jgi:hypothetical protein
VLLEPIPDGGKNGQIDERGDKGWYEGTQNGGSRCGARGAVTPSSLDVQHLCYSFVLLHVIDADSTRGGDV